MHKNNFDLIRFSLAMTVVLGHIIVLSQNASLLPLKAIFDPHIAVSGFFFVSGFLITKSLIRTNSIKEYFKKRGNRLLPGYLFTVLGGMVALSFLSQLSLKDYFTSPDVYKYLVANLTFLNFLHPCLPGVFTNNSICAVNGALWTIKVEVTFYLIVPVLVYLINKFPAKRRWLFLTLIYVGAIIYKYGTEFYFYKTGNGLFDVLSHQLPAFMSYFVCGMAMHYYQPWFMKHKRYLAIVALPVLVLEYCYNLEILMPAALSLIVFFVAYSASFFNNFGKYGDFSYGIYIYHFPLIQLFVSMRLFDSHNPFAISAALIAIVLFMGVLSWNFLEKRFLAPKTTVRPVTN